MPAPDCPGPSGTNDGTPRSARFTSPVSLAIDKSSGNLFVADARQRPDPGDLPIRRHDARVNVGRPSTLLAGYPAQTGAADGTGTGATFYAPNGVAIDSSHNIYVADTGNNRIRKVTPDWCCQTLAGAISSIGSIDGIGNKARFSFPPASR